jgi:hypothetical protein
MSIIVTGTTGGLTDLGTISLHLATMWPTPVTVIEADPDGGRLAARHNWELRPGLAELAAHVRTPATSTLDPQTLRRTYRNDVSVVVAPPSAEQVIAALSIIAPHTRTLDQVLGTDVIINVGRVRPNTPASDIMRAANTRLLISRTDLDDVVALVHRQPLLKELGEWQVLAAGGRYKIDELAKAIEWPVIADLLPSDRRSSAALKSTIAKIAKAHQSIELVDRAVA